MADNLIGAPFNMALSTLESIRKHIDAIAHISNVTADGKILSLGEVQYAKLRMVEQLLVLVSPLLKKEQNKKIRDALKEIKLEKGFSPLVEQNLNDLVILTQVEMQIEKYFMPPKSDPRVGWKQA